MDTGSREGDLGDDGADVDDASALGAEMFGGFLGCQDDAQNV